VSVKDTHLGTVELVAQKLQAAGMNVAQVLHSIGIIGGSIDSNLMNTLSQIEGVKQVEQERTYQLAPPDSDIQ
jgi:DNA anti-recombination protein RmuC